MYQGSDSPFHYVLKVESIEFADGLNVRSVKTLPRMTEGLGPELLEEWCGKGADQGLCFGHVTLRYLLKIQVSM